MKKMYRIIALTGVTALLFTACQKDVKDAPKEEITADVLAQIKGLGFGAQLAPDDHC
jgi:predicted component of type VI protein secretion system